MVRVVAHTQIKKLKLRQKKAHVMEIQVSSFFLYFFGWAVDR